MTLRSLSEAAADVLTRSQSSADKEPMHKLGGAEVQDLGGSTIEKPEGNDVGRQAAAKISQATKPGPAPKLGAMPMQKVAEETDEDDEDYIDEDEEEEVIEEEETLEEKRAMRIAKMKSMSCKEDVEAIFSGQDLSEEFKQKVTTIFEAAVIARAVAVVEELEEQILENAAEMVEQIEEQLEGQMSAYATYVAKEWLAENQLAVDTGLKAEIMEEFIGGLRGLFVEHNINIPDEQVEVVEAMAEEMAELQEELNKALNLNIELVEAINEATKESIVSSVCEGLTATQAEKVKALAEGVEFTTDGEYQEKVELIKESYFSNQVKPQTRKSQVEVKEKIATQSADYSETSPLMEKYVYAISRTIPKT